MIPDGAKVETCTFEYGTPVENNETPLEKTIPCESLPSGEGEAKEPVSANLTGLSEATHYEFRLKATNSLGEGHSGNNSFTTRPTGAERVDASRQERDQRIGRTVSVGEPRGRGSHAVLLRIRDDPGAGESRTVQRPTRQR